MKIFSIVTGLTLSLGLIFFLLSPDLDLEKQENRTDLPWQIKQLADGNIEVFGLSPNVSTLADAVLKFGNYEKVAIFADAAGSKTLEVYFGTKSFGMLKAKIITRLVADPALLEELISQSLKKEPANDKAWKYILDDTTAQQQSDRVIQGITYVPSYRGLDEAFFVSRFGKAEKIVHQNESAQQWLYPDKGLSILINAEGYEILEYSTPNQP